jgi:hypothetical protein
MKTTWIALALILVVACQLIVLSSFHEINGQQGFSESNAIITVAKLSYVNARITLSVFPMVSNGTSNVEIIFPNGSSLNLTSTNGATPGIYTKTFSLPRTGYDFGVQSGGGMYGGNNSVSLTQDNPFVISLKFDVDDPQSYFLTHSVQDMQVSTYIVYGRASISISGYGVAL